MSFFLKYKKTAKQQPFTDAQGCTHTSMRGGCLTVPVEKRAQFLDDYFAAFKRGELLAWTERTPIKDPFRYFMDLDFKHGDENNVDVTTMQRCLSEFVFKFCGEPLVEDSFKRPWDSIAATRGPKMHAHFPSLIVTRKTAEKLTDKIQSGLIRSFPQISPKKWADIVDKRVYKTGFRMLGSRKSQEAEEKERKAEEERVRKENIGEIPLIYKLVLPSGEQCDLEREHLDFCTNFAEPGAEPTLLPNLNGGQEEESAGADESEEETAVERPKKIRKKTTKTPRRTRSASDEEEDEDEEESDETKRVKIPKDVQQDLADITGIEAGLIRYGKMGETSIEIVTHSTECPFSVSGGHKSNHQRLFVSATSVVQKCHSNKCAKSKKVHRNCAKSNEWFLSHFREMIDAKFMDKQVIQILYDEHSKSYNQPRLVDYMNRFVAYVHQNDSYAVRVRGDRPFEVCRKIAVANKLERFETDKSPFSTWCTNANRKEFSEVVFDTSGTKYPPTTLNLFNGYKAKLLDRVIADDEVETFLYHLREVLCKGDAENYDYYLKWWAWFFQRGRTGIMVLLVSEEKGTGKNIILELLSEHVIGDKYVATTDKIDTIVQKFNAINIEKALIVANELQDASTSSKDNGRIAEVLKTLIKDRTTTIEKKGIDPIQVPSTSNYHGASNYLVPLKIDQDQRRYFVLQVSHHKKGDKQYFTELADFVKSHGDEIFTYLNQMDLTDWHPEHNLVQTKYTKRIQRAFVNPVYRFWEDSDYINHDFEKSPAKKDDIYKQYKGWCLDEGYKKPLNSEWFGRHIKKMGYSITKPRAYGDRVRMISGRKNDAAFEALK